MNNKIEFVDQTLRDAQQSLWGFTMRTDHMTLIAEMMDRVGYRAIATVESGIYRAGAAISTRILGEDPGSFQADHKKPLFAGPTRSEASSFDLSTPRDIITLWDKAICCQQDKKFWDFAIYISMKWRNFCYFGASPNGRS